MKKEVSLKQYLEVNYRSEFYGYLHSRIVWCLIVMFIVDVAVLCMHPDTMCLFFSQSGLWSMLLYVAGGCIYACICWSVIRYFGQTTIARDIIQDKNAVIVGKQESKIPDVDLLEITANIDIEKQKEYLTSYRYPGGMGSYCDVDDLEGKSQEEVHEWYQDFVALLRHKNLTFSRHINKLRKQIQEIELYLNNEN